jgi:cob(I)alamin adenosyltransferase
MSDSEANPGVAGAGVAPHAATFPLGGDVPAGRNREQPLVLVHTGHGKGKSSSAFGVMLRGWAAGWRVGVYQFVKSAKWKVGEHAAALGLDTLEAVTPPEGVSAPKLNHPGTIEWHKMGDGWTWTSRDLEESADLAREGWQEVKRRLADATYRLVILDEFTYPMKFGWVDTDEVVATLAQRPGFQHVLITGRDAPDQLRQLADLVSEVSVVTHPYDAGQKGQKGIEW